MSKIYDVIIIGGGIMGSAAAYYLKSTTAVKAIFSWWTKPVAGGPKKPWHCSRAWDAESIGGLLKKIKRYYPLYDPGDLTGGTFGSDDGHFDASAVLMAYKAKAKSLGAIYIKDEVEKIQRKHGRIAGVQTIHEVG